MCLVVYIGSNAELDQINPQDFSEIRHEDSSWPSKVIPFSVEKLTADTEIVAKHFTAKNVKYAGSYEGCGCGFNSCHAYEWEDPIEPDDSVHAGRASRLHLKEYIELHNVLQVYTCWSGEEHVTPTDQIDVNVSQILDSTFEFQQNAMLNIQTG